MEELKLTDLDLDKTCFHFTSNANIESIEKEGLVSKIGDHSKGLENDKKIYFSIGIDNVILLMDKWYRFELSKVIYKKYGLGPRSALARPDVMMDEECIKKTNEIFLDKMKNSTYLAVDLEEGKHYDHNIVDEIKSRSSKEGLDFFYGKDRKQKPVVEDWNMQTYNDIIVEPERISKVNPREGNSAWDLVKEMRQQCKVDPSQTPYLNQVLAYEKRKEMEIKKAPR